MNEELGGDNMVKGKWGLCIDIEGFSKKYEHSERMQNTAIMALNQLMSAVIKIGEDVYPGDPDNNYSERLFAHQFGDGFVITSDFYERNAERCIAIAISLMRHMMMRGYATKVAISTGGMSDLSGCYPERIKDSKCNRVQIGRGLMTTVSVMGTALTRSNKLLSRISGSVLVLDESRFEIIPRKVVASRKEEYSTIDWLSNELTLAQEISAAANLEYGDRDQLLKRFDRYITQEPVPPPYWVESTLASWKC